MMGVDKAVMAARFRDQTRKDFTLKHVRVR